MKLNSENILSVLDIEKWQVLQDSLAAVTGMAIITVDYKGTPVTEHSRCSEFCKRVRSNVILNAECQKCDSRGGLEATRLRRPYIYLCHANILDAAIPIIVNNQYLGALMIGQVLLTDKSEAAELEILCISSKQKLKQQLGKDISFLNQLPRLSLSRVKMIVDMLFHLCNYIVEEATEKSLALDLCASAMQIQTHQLQDDFSIYGAKKLQSIRRKLDSAIINTHITAEATGEREVTSKTLKPALNYINTHKGERCSLAEMAALCHLSPSHFSRLFSQEMGETYSSYLLRARIKWAKDLLITTDKHINEIATMVGFSDAGHFIRSFKKYEGTTPARFRKLKL